MNIRKSRDLAWAYGILTFVLAIFGASMATWLWRFGDVWRVGAIIFALGVVLILYGVFIEPKRLRVRRYRESLVPNPSVWIRCVLLSDFHVGGGRKLAWYERIAIETQALDPDILILAGDYVVDVADPIDLLAPIADIAAHLGRYFVLGNHDFLDQPTLIRERLCSWGFVDLTNRSLSISKEGKTLQLTGQDDHWHGCPIVPPFRANPNLPHVTIAHEPDAALDFAEGDTDLLLAGHTHGGQIRLPLIGPLAGIPAFLGRAVDRGRRVVNGIPLIISQGLGEADLHARLGCTPEIVVVEIGI